MVGENKWVHKNKRECRHLGTHFKMLFAISHHIYVNYKAIVNYVALLITMNFIYGVIFAMAWEIFHSEETSYIAPPWPRYEDDVVVINQS